MVVSVDTKDGFVERSCDTEPVGVPSDVSGRGGSGLSDEVAALCLRSGVLGTFRRPPTS